MVYTPLVICFALSPRPAATPSRMLKLAQASTLESPLFFKWFVPPQRPESAPG
jgi:hypothetical protein